VIVSVIAETANMQEPDDLQAASIVTIDTTAGSLIHRAVASLSSVELGNTFYVSKLYFAAISLAFFPLLVCAHLSPLPLFYTSPNHSLPFLYDWNVLFMFLVSFPCLAILTVTDQPVLSHSLKSVLAEGTIKISEEDRSRLAARWRRIFRLTNLAGQVAGVIIGAVVAYFNFVAYTPALIGFWIADNGHLLPVGFAFLYCIFLFYALVALYVC
jgi:hypothetical protein